MNTLLRRAVAPLIPALSVLGGCSAALAAEVQTPPNIVVIVADDLSPEWCNFLPEGNGKSLTPRLDALAKEGVVLRNMHSPSPICTPSRYALLTGKTPSRATNEEFRREAKLNDGQTAVGFNTFIQANEDNLARRLKSAGYFTGAVGKNHVIDVPGWKKLRYKTKLDAPGTSETLVANAKALKEAFQGAGFDYANDLYYGNADADGIAELASHNQEWVTAGAVEFLDQAKGQADGKPFFLYMATTIPHGPHEADRSWKANPRITPDGIIDNPPQVQPARSTLPERLKEAGISGWNRENVLWLDDAVGAVVDRLKQNGQFDNTIVVFMSDHGTASKGAIYNRGTNTVAMVCKPGGFAVGSTTEAPLMLTDFVPTLLNWAHVKYDAAEFDGRDFTTVLSGKEASTRSTLYLEVGYTRAVVKDGLKYLAVRYPKRATGMSLEERQRRLAAQTEELTARGRPIPTTDPNAPFSHLTLVPGGADAEQVSIKSQPAYFDADQLYDLRVDPDERVNLAHSAEYAARLTEMKALLTQELHRVPGTFGEFVTESSNHASVKGNP